MIFVCRKIFNDEVESFFVNVTVTVFSQHLKGKDGNGNVHGNVHENWREICLAA